MKKLISTLLCIEIFLTACSGASSATSSGSTGGQFTPAVTMSDTPTSQPSETPLPTVTITPNPTPTVDVTATWAIHPAKQVTAPILLYHHIADKDDRYYISPAVFRQQMESLKGMGYTGINMTKLVEVLLRGGELPERPVVITFDDGDLDVYQNAFPIMQELGLVGTIYIVGTRLNSNDFLSVDQMKEMISAGWDVGCHSMTHIDLTLNHDALTYEAGTCKGKLENTLTIPINTFAYPFGSMDEFVAQKVVKYGYMAAVGLGTSSEHTWNTLFYLNRLEVQNNYDMATFSALLPWTESGR